MLLENDYLFLLDDDLFVLFLLIPILFLDECNLGAPIFLCNQVGVEFFELILVQIARGPLVLYAETTENSEDFFGAQFLLFGNFLPERGIIGRGFAPEAPGGWR